ncbi:peptidase [Peterkaempfera bronchialis]|uniref:Peptidase n=1 Tax=Peterkaempfera bronchialis TaxID=2126346 RepID=A0A345T559_9ACTN|nr:peptidase [Peterkaempfera bronchialis]
MAAAARRRAARAGDAEVDTGHLLHSVLESDPEALAAAAPQQRQAARLMGYLVQRSIGFGRDWRATAESRPPVRAANDRPGAVGRLFPSAARPRWSCAAAAALERVADRPVGLPVGLSLLAALAAEPGCRAAQILRSAGIDPAQVQARCAVVPQSA